MSSALVYIYLSCSWNTITEIVKNRLGVEAWSSGGKSSLDIEAERQT